MRRSRFFANLGGRPPVHQETGDGAGSSRELFCPWEIPLDHELAVYLEPWLGYEAAYFPFCWDSIPEAATQALTELIAVRQPHDMMVVPAGVRRIRGTDVYCPTQVLAAGERGVALWVDDLPFDRVTAILAYRDIRMVEHTSDTDSARLTVIGAARRFTVHYRCRRLPSTEHRLAHLLMRIRSGTAGLSNKVGQNDGDDCVTGGSLLPAELAGSRVMASLSTYKRSKRPPWKQLYGIASVTDSELVLLRLSATQSACSGGSDLLAVPRNHLREISVTGAGLCIDAGATHTFLMGAAFARRVVKELWPIAAGPILLPQRDLQCEMPPASLASPPHSQTHGEANRLAHGGRS
jgi:hypothetical protein